jgi:carbonic anhydrase
MSFLRRTHIYQRRYLKYDLTAGLVVFLVAIPLCLGIALASGAPLLSGIIAGVIGGIVVGIISESPISVSGPAAGMIAIVISAITNLGSFETFLLAVVFAGFLQILIGSLRAGFIANYIPSNVIQGLLCAIGILIIIKQIPLAFTHPEKNAALMSVLKTAAQNLDLKSLIHLNGHINLGATLITLLSIAILLFFDYTRNARLKAIPGPIIVVLAGVLINQLYIFFWPSLVQSSAELVSLPVHDTFKNFCDQLACPAWKNFTNPSVYFYGLMIAAIASLETLLNLEAAEKLDGQRKHASRDRELVGQGIGNILAGLVGGIPITSVVVRSSVNIQTGAKTKIATIFHGLLILLTVAFIPGLLKLIPLASLAAILIYIGYKLSKISIYQEMYAQGFSRFFPFVVTVLAIVFTNLLLGILIGLFLSFFFILKDNNEIKLDIINEKHPFGIVKRIVLPQQVSFLRKASLVTELDMIPENSQLIIDARYAKYIDSDILDLLRDFVKRRAPSKKIAVNLLGFKPHYQLHNRIDFLNVTTYDVQSALQPEQVLEILKEGNQRFFNDQPIHRSLPDEIKALSTTQHPIAVVLGCIDSRVPVETIFDMGVGDIFVIRIAGNIVNDDILASLEFACHISGAKLILVLGHTNCGAIKAACDAPHHIDHNLSHLLNKIKPAIEAEKTTLNHRNSDNADYLRNVTELNVINTVKKIYSESNVLNRLINDKAIQLTGALYDIKTGRVDFDIV